jgi:hypothetical protein
MTPTRCAFSILTALALLTSCAQRLPDVSDLDHFYQHAEKMAQADRQDLERRHASGALDDYSYQQQKTALENRISQQAIEMAWTSHSLEKARRESLGIPTADHPKAISVPQAGSLPTGSEYRRFNDPDTITGTTDSTVGGMMRSSGYTPGMSGVGRSRGL